jgi:hypothetical protein
MYIERDKENISTQELENDAKDIRQTKNPCLSFSTSVCASADKSWGEWTIGYHSLDLCVHQLMVIGEKGPLVIIL